MKNIKLKTFNTCQKKTSCNIDNKLVKLREDRQLLAIFLVVQQARPSMIQSQSDTIGKYEFPLFPSRYLPPMVFLSSQLIRVHLSLLLKKS